MFFTAVNNMVDTKKVLEGREFLIQQPKGVTGKNARGEETTFTFMPGQHILFLRLQATFSSFDRNGYNGERTTLSTIEQNLRSHPAYLGTVPSRRFEWLEVEEHFDIGVQKVIKDEVLKRTSTSAVILDYDILMQSYGIDFRRDQESGGEAVATQTAVQDPAAKQSSEQDLPWKDGDVF